MENYKILGKEGTLPSKGVSTFVYFLITMLYFSDLLLFLVIYLTSLISCYFNKHIVTIYVWEAYARNPIRLINDYFYSKFSRLDFIYKKNIKNKKGGGLRFRFHLTCSSF